MKKMLVLVAALAATATLASVAVPAARAYGNNAQYQATISLNCDNKSAFFCTNIVGLGGVWKWFAFNTDRSFDSTETFCAHNDPVFGSGAFHFNGDGEWTTAAPSPEAPPFGQSLDFWVNYNDGQGWQDSLVPYPGPGVSMHYSAKLGPGISAEAQVSAIPGR
jgi:hypothetical protein